MKSNECGGPRHRITKTLLPIIATEHGDALPERSLDTAMHMVRFRHLCAHLDIAHPDMGHDIRDSRAMLRVGLEDAAKERAGAAGLDVLYGRGEGISLGGSG